MSVKNTGMGTCIDSPHQGLESRTFGYLQIPVLQDGDGAPDVCGSWGFFPLQ